MRQYEHPEPDDLALEPFLLELTAEQRTREIIEADLPNHVTLPGDILRYGQQLVERSIDWVRRTGQPTEALFAIGIDPATSQFTRVTCTTDPRRTNLTQEAEGVVGFSPHVGIGARAQLLLRAARMMLGGHQMGHWMALEAHTHPPLVLPKLDGSRYQGVPDVVKALELPFLAALPSTPDIVKLTSEPPRFGSLVFTPGVTFLMVGTDRTPQLSDAEHNNVVRQGNAQAVEREQLLDDYLTALDGQSVSPALEGVLREMYAGRQAPSTPASVLLRQNLAHLIAGGSDVALFNPVAFRQLTDVRHQLEALHAVGYYHLTAAQDNRFIRFTQQPLDLG